ncbi:MAG: WD40/YVTN/BNR-like repeat-containing protein, partial [Isosphaeraceae bacterium]
SAQIGYLFGPALFVTRDGGRTWTPQKSSTVEGLEPAGATVVRLVYDHTGCPGPCNRLVQESAAGSTAWRTLLRISYGSVPEGSAEVIRQGSQAIYVPIFGNIAAGAGTQHALILRSRDAGRTWRQLNDPCGGSANAIFDAVAFAAAPNGFLSSLCAPRGGNGSSQFVLTSNDFGFSWSPRHGAPAWAGMISAASSTRVVLGTPAVGGSGPFDFRLAVSTDGGRHWVTVVTDREQIDPNAPDTSFLGFENASVGRWVGYPNAIWTTEDGGIHWTRRNFA